MKSQLLTQTQVKRNHRLHYRYQYHTHLSIRLPETEQDSKERHGKCTIIHAVLMLRKKTAKYRYSKTKTRLAYKTRQKEKLVIRVIRKPKGKKARQNRGRGHIGQSPKCNEYSRKGAWHKTKKRGKILHIRL